MRTEKAVAINNADVPFYYVEAFNKIPEAVSISNLNLSEYNVGPFYNVNIDLGGVYFPSKLLGGQSYVYLDVSPSDEFPAGKVYTEEYFANLFTDEKMENLKTYYEPACVHIEIDDTILVSDTDIDL